MMANEVLNNWALNFNNNVHCIPDSGAFIKDKLVMHFD